jgi:hypothetical protein
MIDLKVNRDIVKYVKYFNQLDQSIAKYAINVY